jgi:DnaJ-class molecular chaperone
MARSVSCPICGRSIASDADCCPECGTKDIPRGELQEVWDPSPPCDACNGSGSIGRFVKKTYSCRGSMGPYTVDENKWQRETCGRCGGKGRGPGKYVRKWVAY